MDYGHQRAGRPLGVESSASAMNSEPPPHPPKYVMLSDHNGSLRPPPYRRNIPRYLSSNHRSKNPCMRCICCFYCVLLIFVFIVAALSFYFYAVFQPQVPSYNVQNLDVGAFNIQPDFSLYAEFTVSVKAENPNAHIGFIYGKGSFVDVGYQEATLCSGKLPAFYQDHKNTTMMKVLLKGKSEFGSGLQEALLKNKNNGKVPLLIQVKVPVSIVIGNWPLRQFMVLVNCSLVVDNLAPNKKAQILSSKNHVSVAF